MYNDSKKHILDMKEFDSRALQILRQVIHLYCQNGLAVGSKTLAQLYPDNPSPATLRAIMADLEEKGLLYAPYPSAGRLPTEAGLRIFVNELMAMAPLPMTEEIQAPTLEQGVLGAFEKIVDRLSTLSQCVGLICTPKANAHLKSIEWVKISASRALLIFVTTAGGVENALVPISPAIEQEDLVKVSNYLNHLLQIRGGALHTVLAPGPAHEEDAFFTHYRALIESVIDLWRDLSVDYTLLIKGQAYLLKAFSHHENLGVLEEILDRLESKTDLMPLLQTALIPSPIGKKGNNVYVSIGREQELAWMEPFAAVFSKYGESQRGTLGAVGVIGPRWLPYERIITLVSYTAQQMGQLFEF